MKKLILSTALIALQAIVSFSQNLTVPLSAGGANDGGTILTVDLSTGTPRVTPMQGMTEVHEYNINGDNP